MSLKVVPQIQGYSTRVTVESGIGILSQEVREGVTSHFIFFIGQVTNMQRGIPLVIR